MKSGEPPSQRGILEAGSPGSDSKVPSTRPQLTSCVHATCALLYPMRWEHVLIPTLPPHLLDYCW